MKIASFIKAAAEALKRLWRAYVIAVSESWHKEETEEEWWDRNY